MSTGFTVNATVRQSSGKGASRRARASSRVPAVLYGQGKPTIGITVDPKELAKALTGPLRRNAVVTLKLKDEAGKEQGSRPALVRDMQIHPLRRTPTHCDFQEIALDKPVKVKVPLEATGKSKAVLDGAKLQLVTRTINVQVMPNAIPEKIVLDVTDAGFGVLRAKVLKMPAGVTLLDHPETPVVSLRIPRGDKEEAAATPAEGAAAATPAADGKAAGPAAAGDKKDAKAAEAPKADDKKKK